MEVLKDPVAVVCGVVVVAIIYLIVRQLYQRKRSKKKDKITHGEDLSEGDNENLKDSQQTPHKKNSENGIFVHD